MLLVCGPHFMHQGYALPETKGCEQQSISLPFVECVTGDPSLLVSKLLQFSSVCAEALATGEDVGFGRRNTSHLYSHNWRQWGKDKKKGRKKMFE